MTHERFAVLRALSEQPEPVSVYALSQIMRRHPNTLREQVAWLRSRGLVAQSPAPTQGRGRPAWLYRANGPRSAAPEPTRALAELLRGLGEADSTVESAWEYGYRTGQQWCADHDVASIDGAVEARLRVVAVLDEQGYAPQADPDAIEIDLTRCPLLQTAYAHPEVVCAAHLGIVDAALDTVGASSDRTELVPFAGPGVCQLRLECSAGP